MVVVVVVLVVMGHLRYYDNVHQYTHTGMAQPIICQSIIQAINSVPNNRYINHCTMHNTVFCTVFNSVTYTIE